MLRHPTTAAALFLVLMPMTAGAEGPKESASESEPWRVEAGRTDTPVWRRAIDQITSSEAVKSGAYRYSLMRIVLEGQEPEDNLPEEEELRIVNGVPVRTTGRGVSARATPPSRVPRRWSDSPEASITVWGVKVGTLDDVGGGGGVSRKLQSGDFVLVEHINGTHRRGGKDPVQIYCRTHGYAQLWTPVPPRGELGVVGEVILRRIDPALLGRLVVEIKPDDPKSLRPQSLYVMPMSSAYGDRYPVSEQGIAASDPMVAGAYRVRLVTGNRRRDRVREEWLVHLHPGSVTYLRCSDSGEGPVRAVGSETFTPGSNPPMSLPH